MNILLVRIKRAVLSGNVVFTDKANTEMECDGLFRSDVTESIVSAQQIYKTIRSTNPQPPWRARISAYHSKRKS